MNKEINIFCVSVNTSISNKEKIPKYRQNEQPLKNERRKSIENARQTSIKNSINIKSRI
jgi:hypothetical protein